MVIEIEDGGKYVSKAVYTVLGVNMEGKKYIRTLPFKIRRIKFLA